MGHDHLASFAGEELQEARMNELEALRKQIPNHLVIEKRLWVGKVSVDIDHIGNDLDKPLDYVKAFKEMIDKLKKTTVVKCP